ncbi:MAG: DMT family transporter [Dehalococcoidales bacterium]|nr:DMT family transporter [Dehalococcoidales bacterium]
MNHLLAGLKSSTGIAVILLIGVTAVWGWTFISVKDAVLKMPVMDFLAIRFSIAAITLILLRPKTVSRISRRQLWHGIILGAMLGSAYITQTFGLQITSPATAGFITGMAVVLTPIVAWLVMKEKIRAVTWVAVGLETIGLALLSLQGWVFGKGEFLVLICAFCLAGHIVGLGKWTSIHETYGLAMVQVTVAALICLAAAVPGGIMAPPDFTVWTTVFITAILATSVAFVVQTWAQKLISSTQAAVILTMEPVFAGVFTTTIGGEVLTPRTIVGAVCVITAMLMVQLKAGSRTVSVHEP